MINLFRRNTALKFKNIRAEEFKNIKAKNPEAVILDVRTAGEVKDGKIPGASLLNLMDRQFSEKIDKLDKEKTYLVYCRSGNRSGQACAIMADKGFKKVYNLEGGINYWPYNIEL